MREHPSIRGLLLLRQRIRTRNRWRLTATGEREIQERIDQTRRLYGRIKAKRERERGTR